MRLMMSMNNSSRCWVLWKNRLTSFATEKMRAEGGKGEKSRSAEAQKRRKAEDEKLRGEKGKKMRRAEEQKRRKQEAGSRRGEEQKRRRWEAQKGRREEGKRSRRGEGKKNGEGEGRRAKGEWWMRNEEWGIEEFRLISYLLSKRLRYCLTGLGWGSRLALVKKLSLSECILLEVLCQS